MADKLSPADCVIVSPEDSYCGKQTFEYFAGVSAQSAGSAALCMHLVTIPPAGRAQPHLHRSHETALYVLSGQAGMWYGEGLRKHLSVRAGQFLYIPANMPHLAYNLSQTEPCTAVVARTDPNEQESVELYNAPDPGSGPKR